jgi:hypothetical protein
MQSFLLLVLAGNRAGDVLPVRLDTRKAGLD